METLLVIFSILASIWAYSMNQYTIDAQNTTIIVDTGAIFNKIKIIEATEGFKTFVEWKKDIEVWEKIWKFQNSKYVKWKVDFDELREAKSIFWINGNSDNFEVFAMKYFWKNCHYVRAKLMNWKYVSQTDCKEFILKKIPEIQLPPKKDKKINFKKEDLKNEEKNKRDTERMIDLGNIQTKLLSYFADNWFYPDSLDAKDFEEYLEKEIKDIFDWKIINWCKFGYKYEALEKNWIENSGFRLSSCMEASGKNFVIEG